MTGDPRDVSEIDPSIVPIGALSTPDAGENWTNPGDV